MTDLTAPWSPDAPAWLREGVARPVSTVQAIHPDWAEPITLDVQAGTVTFDEGWVPHVQADLECALPADQSVLDVLDFRDGVRIRITAGYIYPGGQRDEHLLADLGLRTRTVARDASSGDRLTLSAASDEALALDAGPTVLPGDVYEAPAWRLAWMLEGRLPIVLGYTPVMDMDECPNIDVPVAFDSRTSQWDTIKGAVDTAAGWLRDRGDRTWVCTPWPERVGEPVYLFAVGQAGNINKSDVQVSREDWANVAVVTYSWTNTAGDPQSVAGWAWVTGEHAGITGPSGHALPGVRVYRETREGQASQAQADQVARAILGRRLRTARSAAITAARAAWWVRPGLTTTIRLPSGGDENHLVSRAAFDLVAGSMTVTTRQPSNTPIATGA